MRLNKTLMIQGEKETFDKADCIAINRDLENIFSALQILDNRPRTVSLNPQDGTPASRPNSNYIGEVVYYSSNLYFCTNISTPTWKKITAT